jgi:tRNA A37 threonylcarbamoyladenosine synthetase subunit TsaC/SUA5/YrdC
LNCLEEIPSGVGDTLAVRIPGHALLRAVLYRTGPVTGTSANRHGQAPCSTVDQALESLIGAPDLALDGGRTTGDRPSTLVDLSGDEPRVLREGAFDWNEPFPWDEA